MIDTIRVVLTDDHPVVRQGIKSLLEKGDGIEVVGEASTGEETIQKVKELLGDIISLKENVVMGHLIPAGTGLRKYSDILLKTEMVVPETAQEEEVQVTE